MLGIYYIFVFTAKFEQRLMSRVNVISENDLGAIEYFSYSTLIYIFDGFWHLLPTVFLSSQTYFVNQLREKHLVNISRQGDFLVDNHYIFEIGGKNKPGKQILGLDNRFIVHNDIEIGYRNFIPLWLFGFLY